MDAAAASERTVSSAGRLLSGRRRRWRWINWHPTAVTGLTVFGLIALAAAFAPLLTPYDPNDQVLLDRLQLPSAAHRLGTDTLGRDVFARILYGGRFSLVITLASVLISGTLGTLIGAVAGRVGGVVDEVVMRLIDLFIAFPGIIVALVIAAMLKPGFWTLVLAMTMTTWTPYARLARAIALEINTRAYIEAAIATGASEFTILRKHVLHNMMGPVLAMGFLRFGHMLLTIAGLSYLGLGAQPPTPDWGAMLAEAQPYMQRVPSLILAPGLTIFITTLSVTLAGQGLMLMFDPQQTWAKAR
jgi:peptide/nickel transport system permease protein